MTTIKFKKVGLTILYDFDSDDIIDIITSDVFKRYINDGYMWGVVGVDGLTFAERSRKPYENK